MGKLRYGTGKGLVCQAGITRLDNITTHWPAPDCHNQGAPFALISPCTLKRPHGQVEALGLDVALSTAWGSQRSAAPVQLGPLFQAAVAESGVCPKSLWEPLKGFRPEADVV